MSDDIVDRLRASSHQHKDAHAIRLEAADEITRLRARVEELEKVLWFYQEKAAALAAYGEKKHGQAMEAVVVELINDSGDRARRALRGETK